MIYQMLKFFKRIAFHPEVILRPLFCFSLGIQKYRFINSSLFETKEINLQRFC